MIRVELHAHTTDDPHDKVPHSAEALIEQAAALGYGGLAITLHDRPFDPGPLIAFARARGVVLIRGLERTVQGKHVLLLNFPEEAIDVTDFDTLRQLKARTAGLVVAPHPFYPIPSALGPQLTEHADLFDAVEVNAMFVAGLDFNRKAVDWARRHGRPLVGNADVHRLIQLGTTWSEVDVPPGADADVICDAIRAGRVRVAASALSYARAGRIFGEMILGDVRRTLGLP